VTGAERSPLVPDLPPCAETLPGLVAISWWGVFMPAGTPKAINDKFHGDLVTSMQDAGVKKKFADLGVEAVYDTSEHFAAFIKSETAKYGKLIKDAGIKANEPTPRHGVALRYSYRRLRFFRRGLPAISSSTAHTAPVSCLPKPLPSRRCRSARSPRRAVSGSRVRERSHR